GGEPGNLDIPGLAFLHPHALWASNTHTVLTWLSFSSVRGEWKFTVMLEIELECHKRFDFRF
ncbi:hypothetical protein Tco_0403155, partial [Tanacetum coccineum]